MHPWVGPLCICFYINLGKMDSPVSYWFSLFNCPDSIEIESLQRHATYERFHLLTHAYTFWFWRSSCVVDRINSKFNFRPFPCNFLHFLVSKLCELSFSASLYSCLPSLFIDGNSYIHPVVMQKVPIDSQVIDWSRFFCSERWKSVSAAAAATTTTTASRVW